jgi:hypothetical protein
MRHKKRSVAALHEHFCNEISMNFGHLQLEAESFKSSKGKKYNPIDLPS